MEQIYTAQEIAEILQQEGDKEMTVRKVRHYAEIGLLPDRAIINGRKRFTEEHLEYLRATRTMKKTGESLDNIKRALNHLNADNIRNIGTQLNHYSSETLINTQTHHFNSDIAFTFSNQVSSEIRNDIIETVTQILKSNKLF
ncbi:MerR family transcriptional regulator [Bacillus cereus]|uniref:MerR family transcriptional regulator n=1 Tax=Bacillus cereus TaxID=1396 RepID=UPI003078EFFB